jgi:hypothetical protein
MQLRKKKAVTAVATVAAVAIVGVIMAATVVKQMRNLRRKQELGAQVHTKRGLQTI